MLLDDLSHQGQVDGHVGAGKGGIPHLARAGVGGIIHVQQALTQQIDSRAGIGTNASPSGTAGAVDFVCEEDVRQAIRAGQRITVHSRTIVTPAARDLANAHQVLVEPGWPR